MEDSSLSSTKIQHNVTHQIETKGQPVFVHARKLLPIKLRAFQAEFDRMIANGICRPSKSAWSSPLHMVPKPDGTWRPCVDYRALNAKTVPDKYPVRHIQDFASNLFNNAIKPLKTKVSAIENFTRPQNRQELRRFIGMVNFYRRFLPNAAEIQLPLKNDNTVISFEKNQTNAPRRNTIVKDTVASDIHCCTIDHRLREFCSRTGHRSHSANAA